MVPKRAGRLDPPRHMRAKVASARLGLERISAGHTACELHELNRSPKAGVARSIRAGATTIKPQLTGQDRSGDLRELCHRAGSCGALKQGGMLRSPNVRALTGTCVTPVFVAQESTVHGSLSSSGCGT